ncbi:SusC/RagA family TonB-linked outer membrane protein [Niastella vici]|uniref:SusC/RagA family TonB-linked outer membrane protein n=1 Tax=Niastella vici TaxID=1703345 RepID=A0A1V9FX20_9BACT|nr:TonB-dependent receptor [Niastella vici]OQP62786.1 SusC/RagA family TonB-linked outer membrane protein [Niastella vici]
MSVQQLLPKGVWLLPVFLLFTAFHANSQNTTGNGTVTGKITDETGTGIPGATIQVKGTDKRTIAKEDGTFTIPVTTGRETLVITSVGFTRKEVPLNGLTIINISLAGEKNTLEDVVVIGYGTQKKRNVTAAQASFDASRLDERPVTRVDQALVGQMAGVTVKQTSGALGKGFSIQVRGTGSISASNEPLYVVDGFPLTPTGTNAAGNYANGNPLDNLNPNDIEDVQVLKDAAAAAIYGSRAANGVVLITTKRGKSGKTKIGFNSYVGFVERSKKLDMLKGDEWIDRFTEMVNARYVAEYGNKGATANDNNDRRRQVLGVAPGAYNTAYMTDERWTQPGHPGLRFIDWQDETFRKGLMQNHQVSASGGTDVVRYYISGNMARQEGMVKYTDYTSYSARANVEVNANKKLRFGLNISPTYSITNDPGVEGKDNIFHQILSMSPVQEDTMGLYPNVGNNDQYAWSTSTNSPFAKLQYVIGETKRFRTLTTLFGEYQIIPGLSFKSTINLDNTDNDSKSYRPYRIASSKSTRLAQTTLQTSGSFSSFKKMNFVNENTLSYNKTINEVHDIAAVVGFTYNSEKIDNQTLSSNGGFKTDGVITLSGANGVTGETRETKNFLLSYLGRVQYSYNGKYMLSASIRRDGSSRFGENSKWGYFPSASVGWRVSEEEFLKAVPFINDLKVRGSWGKAGNYAIGDYATIPLLKNYNYSLNTVSVIGQAPAGPVNPDLTWEKSETFDAGIDITVLKNRLSASFDIYTKHNTGLLLNVPILWVTGYSNLLANAGETRNKGWELEITSRNLVKGPVQWTTSLNLSHNTNKVLALSGGQNQTIIPSAYGTNVQHSILRVGEPMYSVFVVKQIGILTQDDINKGVALYGSETVGDPKYEDYSGDGVIDLNDRQIVAHPNPDYIYGITNTVRYKGFDLAVLVQGQRGGSIYSLLGRALGRTGQGTVDNALGFFRDRWRSPDVPGAGKVGKAYSTFGQIANTDWLYSSDYIRVRMITLGYDLNRVIKAKKVMQAARIYITAENFFGHDKYKGGLNPDANNTDLSGSTQYLEPGDYGGLPLPKSLILGVNITF